MKISRGALESCLSLDTAVPDSCLSLLAGERVSMSCLAASCQQVVQNSLSLTSYPTQDEIWCHITTSFNFYSSSAHNHIMSYAALKLVQTQCVLCRSHCAYRLVGTECKLTIGGKILSDYQTKHEQLNRQTNKETNKENRKRRCMQSGLTVRSSVSISS